MALSTVFQSINSPDNSPLSHSVLLVLFLPYWSFQLYRYIFVKVSLSPDVILCFSLGFKHQLPTYLTNLRHRWLPDSEVQICLYPWQLSFCKRINVWNERSRTEHALCVCMCVYTCMCVNECVNERLNVRDSAVVAYAFDINQLSLPTLFFFILFLYLFLTLWPFQLYFIP